MIQRMLAIWSLVPLPFLKPAWTTGSSWFTCCWSLAWKILSITLLACAAAAAAKSLQSYPTLCDPIDGSPPGSSIPGILQARTLEWVAISFSNAWKWKVKVKSLSHVRLFEIPWTAAYQVPLSMEFSRQEYWIGLPFPTPGDLPNAEIKPFCISCTGRQILYHCATWKPHSSHPTLLNLYIQDIYSKHCIVA